MRRLRTVLRFLAFGVLIVAILNLIVMRLWNWLMPALFGWHLITFWQALGILILCKILFGGFRGRSGPPMLWRKRMLEWWAHMTPEEREKVRQSMQGRSGRLGASAV
jgi:hypothetical protein